MELKGKLTSSSDVLRDLSAIQPGNTKIILAANKMDLRFYANPEDWQMMDLLLFRWLLSAA